MRCCSLTHMHLLFFILIRCITSCLLEEFGAAHMLMLLVLTVLVRPPLLLLIQAITSCVCWESR